MIGKAIAVAGFLAFVGLAGLHAHEGATGIVKERMDVMKSFGDSVKVMKDMLMGKASYDAAKIKEAARAMQEHAGEEMTAMFPEGSLDDHTEALPAIWEDWDRFSRLAGELRGKAAALEAAADDQAAFAAAFKDLGDTCLSCHTKFRKEVEED